MSSASLKLWEYRETEIANVQATGEPVETPASLSMPAPSPVFTEAEVLARIAQALQTAEQRWADASEEKETNRREQMQSTLQAFAKERMRYFRDAEAEVVHLALAIARKILGREASLDPDLLAALVRIGLERIGATQAVKVRLPADDHTQWQQKKEPYGFPPQYELIADPALTPGECIVETDQGRAQFGLEAQFKVIEEGMLDLLRLRPAPHSLDHAGSTPSQQKGS